MWLRSCLPDARAFHPLFRRMTHAQSRGGILIQTVDDFEDILIDGTGEQVASLSFCDVSPLSYSISGDSMTVRFGSSESRLHGLQKTPNCVDVFGMSHDFAAAVHPTKAQMAEIRRFQTEAYEEILSADDLDLPPNVIGCAKDRFKPIIEKYQQRVATLLSS